MEVRSDGSERRLRAEGSLASPRSIPGAQQVRCTELPTQVLVGKLDLARQQPWPAGPASARLKARPQPVGVSVLPQLPKNSASSSSSTAAMGLSARGSSRAFGGLKFASATGGGWRQGSNRSMQ
ncbi:unnamed protein product, partial [Polarella glacialis]